jgi:hypothetical protein
MDYELIQMNDDFAIGMTLMSCMVLKKIEIAE